MKSLRIILALLSTVVILHIVNQYFFCQRYQTETLAPFSGDYIYNPYDSVSLDGWLKCNFHAHCATWGGVTNGNGTAADLHHAYGRIGYDVHCVSNYQQIDTTQGAAGIYIPAYEHGYNLKKTHQLILGAERVYWGDYIFPQVTSNKQHVLNQLAANQNAVIVLTHPVVRDGYTAEDLAELTNYHCMEVLNPAGRSFELWDAVLSTGKPVFIVGNDDTHDVLNQRRFRQMCTFVNASSRTQQGVLEALKRGRSYGVVIGPDQDPFSIPKPVAVEMAGDTMSLSVDQRPEQIVLIGQHGRELARFGDTAAIRYVMRPEDGYVRADISYANGTSLHLNPIFFYSGEQEVFAQAAVFPDHNKTLMLRFMGTILLIGWLLWIAGLLSGSKGTWFPVLSKRRLEHKRFSRRSQAGAQRSTGF